MPIIRLLWMFTFGWVIALGFFTLAVLCAVTIIGLPFALLFFAMGVKILTLDF